MMIFEITRDYAVIVPLMISNLVSFFIASRFQKEPIYEVLAHQDGIRLPTAESRVLEGNRRVPQVMRAAAETLHATTGLRDAEAKAKASAMSAWPVVSHEGVIGVLGREAILAAAKNGNAEKKLAELIGATKDFPHLHADHSLHTALDRMGSSGLDTLPVVSRANVHQLLGVVTLDDVLALYRGAESLAEDSFVRRGKQNINFMQRFQLKSYSDRSRMTAPCWNCQSCSKEYSLMD
jgi:chloride channel protein, CIC family